MQSFDREVCRRLPLADAVFRLLDFALADDFLHDVFQRYRGRSYHDVLSFPCFVHLIADALLGRNRSAHRHFQQAHDQGTLPTGIEAVYGKLRRVPLTLSQALLGEAAARLRQLFPDAHDPLPASLDAWEVYALDGKKIKHVAKRLKVRWIGFNAASMKSTISTKKTAPKDSQCGGRKPPDRRNQGAYVPRSPRPPCLLTFGSRY